MLAMLGLAIALAMDATAVAAARGLAGGVSRRDVVLVPALFGGFQAGMAALGWLGARWLGPAIARWDHWIGAILLTGLGVKMIHGALSHRRDEPAPTPDLRDDLLTLFGLALATSIDAAAAGVTLPLLDAPPLLSLAAIGLVTAALSAAGLALGRRLGAAMGPRLEVVGGATLIGLAIKLLIEQAG
jgi:putative Mn2+ efflux pump MntP